MSTHGPIESQFQNIMVDVMRTLDTYLNPGLKAPNKKIGIVMLTFHYGEVDGSRTNYISNGASREDMTKLLRELADRFEGTHPEEQS